MSALPEAALVDPEAWDTILDEAEARYPHESCGVLLGRMGAKAEVLEAHPAPNIDRERAHDRYLMDPRRQLDIEKDARRRGLDVVGYFHSHPDHPSKASATDLERSWEGMLYLIVSVRQGRMASAQSWFRPPSADAFSEIPLHVPSKD